MITRVLLGAGVALVLGCAQAPEPAAEVAECPMHAMHMAGGQMAMDGMEGCAMHAGGQMSGMQGMEGMDHSPAPMAETPEGEPAN